MKTRIILFCGIILALCLWLLLHHAGEQIINTPQETLIVSTNNQLIGLSEQPETHEKHQNTSVPPPANVSSSKKAAWPTAENSSQLALAPWHTPIDFYGKVIDENSNPVVGVSIGFRWAAQTEDVAATTATTQSDAEGIFSLHDKHGVGLSVQVSKEGYYTSQKDKRGFNYALGPDILSPDSSNPVIFHLQKKGKGESLVHIGGIGLHTMRDYLLAADGRPINVSLLDGQLMPAEQGDLQVEFQIGPPLDNFPSRITWSCRVAVPGGGLIQTDEEFPFFAPENGYQTSDNWSVDATNWTQTLDKQYYIKLRDGNFGRVKLRVIGVPNRAFFRMESFLNPSGSRNLEPSN
jgi:hypothetical protein